MRWEIAKSVLMADFVGPRKKWPKSGGPVVKNLEEEEYLCNRSNCSQIFRKQYTIIFYKFQALVTSITRKVIDVTGKNLVLR